MGSSSGVAVALCAASAACAQQPFLRLADVGPLLAEGGSPQPGAMRTLLGTESAKVLVEEAGPEAAQPQYSLLTADLPPGATAARIRRSLIFVPGSQGRPAFLVAAELIQPLPNPVRRPAG